MRAIVLLLFSAMFLVASVVQEKITQDNHPPFSLSQRMEIVTLNNNTIQYRLKGRDPDGDMIFFQIISTPPDGITCSIVHSNVLKCTIQSPHIPSDGKCTLANGKIVIPCKKESISYIIKDEKGLQSRRTYRVDLFLTTKESNLSLLQKSQRAYFYELQDKMALSQYGEGLFGNNPVENLLQSDLFAPGSVFSKEYKFAKEVIETHNLEKLKTEDLLQNTKALNAMEGSAAGTSPQFMNSVRDTTVNQLSIDVNKAPIECLIEREGIKTQTYYLCSLDPYVSVNPAYATHYWATNGYELNALRTCQQACVERSACETKSEEHLQTIVANKSYFDDGSYRFVESKFASMEKLDNLIVVTRKSDGTFLSQDEYSFTPLSGSSLQWDTVYVPSSKRYGAIALKTDFMGEKEFIQTTVGDTFIIRPKRLFYMEIGGKQYLNAVEGNRLYTLFTKKRQTFYTCPIPERARDRYEMLSSCENACQIQRECVKFTESILTGDQVNRVSNYCKDVLVSLSGETLTLPSAVEAGLCRLDEEVVLDEENNIVKYFVKNGVDVDPLRPKLGFGEDPQVLATERAYEVAYAYLDMVGYGKEQGRFDTTLPLQKFVDFSFRPSDKPFATQPLVDSLQGYGRDIWVVTKINDQLLDRVALDATQSVSTDRLHTAGERLIYETYIDLTGTKPSLKDVDGIARELRLGRSIDDAIYGYIFRHAKDQSYRNCFGMVVGLYSVNVPEIVDENTTIEAEFMVLDRFGYLRSVALSSPTIALDESNETQRSVYTAFYELFGREPTQEQLEQWIAFYEDTPNYSLLLSALKEYAKEAYHGFSHITHQFNGGNSFVANDVLKNMALAKNGVFRPATMSFETTVQPIYDHRDRLVVNRHIYNATLEDFTYFKYIKHGDSPLSVPIKVAIDQFRLSKERSIGNYKKSYHYLFAYVDRVENLQHMTVSQLLDLFYHDFQGDKRFFVWDLVDPKKALIKIEGNYFYGLSSDDLTYYLKYFDATSFLHENHFPFESFFEDLSENRHDSVYIAKRDDTYVIKMNAAHIDDSRSDEPVCPQGTFLVQRRCIGSVQPEGCPSGTLYDPRTNRCIGRPYCKGFSLYDPVQERCKKIGNLYNKNGYFFIYLDNGGTKKKFFTPVVGSKPIRCKREPYSCSLTGQIFSSERSCRKYCKKNIPGAHLPETATTLMGECQKVGTATNMLAKSYYDLEGCAWDCYNKKSVQLPSIIIRLALRSAPATLASHISIKRHGSKPLNLSPLVRESGQIEFGIGNKGITTYLLPNDSISIAYSAQQDNHLQHFFEALKSRGVSDKYLLPRYERYKYLTGIGKFDLGYLVDKSELGAVFIPGEHGQCLNMHLFYPNMGIFLEVDSDQDGIFEQSFKISDTLLCYNTEPFTLRQTIIFEGDRFKIEYLDQRGKLHTFYKEIVINDIGMCRMEDTGRVDSIALANTYLPSDFFSSPITKLPKYDLERNATVNYSNAPVQYSLGLIEKDMSEYEKGFNDLQDIKKLAKAIDEKKIIPIPFAKGVFLDKPFDVLLKDTGVDPKYGREFANYSMKAGFGFTPWSECKKYDGDVPTTKYQYVPKNSCRTYPGFWYEANIDKCVGNASFIAGHYSCAVGTLHGDRCHAPPVCPEGYSPDSSDIHRCFKLVLGVKEGEKKICKPWWRIKRTYVCNGSVDPYNLSNFITASPPRYIDVCKDRKIIYKSLTIDKNGNIVERK